MVRGDDHTAFFRNIPPALHLQPEQEPRKHSDDQPGTPVQQHSGQTGRFLFFSDHTRHMVDYLIH